MTMFFCRLQESLVKVALQRQSSVLGAHPGTIDSAPQSECTRTSLGQVLGH
ncbi:hypothetical protein IE4872_PC00129 (plasmid) [Rhizobium gallicum]|uniref:Uncharacterized protein n=2 Tax=Rhizobium gallicum TaxID=56730 RepID=A0A0B4X950_9HYPH|nr:hypothetical protein RGR602_PB00137 [Rhizobium gallicum bv. gallicum R602sp]APO70160.1 hypothetical protein IE4872_PC00129 [Rhizobium gallicum]